MWNIPQIKLRYTGSYILYALDFDEFVNFMYKYIWMHE
jgi:hypothetical protein